MKCFKFVMHKEDREATWKLVVHTGDGTTWFLCDECMDFVREKVNLDTVRYEIISLFTVKEKVVFT